MIFKVRNLFGLEGELVKKDRLQVFKEYYLEHSDYVRKIIFWMVRDDSVDDLVQETFLKAWRSFQEFEGKSSFKTWIHRIAINTTNDYFRRNKNKREEFYEESMVVDFETKQLIHLAIMKMNLKLREVFILYYYLGHTSLEIADLLSRSEGTVKYQIKEAREIFKEFFKSEGVHYEG